MPQAPVPRREWLIASAAALPVAGCATAGSSPSVELARAQVRDSERAFAATMAQRDLAAFARFVADDAVFINGGQPLRGKPAIVEHWARFFKEPAAPFAWEPTLVEISGGAQLGYTEGPVTAAGQVIARFYSTWQRQANGPWLVVFDNGYAECKR